MPFSKLRTRGRASRLGISAAAALMPLLLGAPLMYWQTVTHLRQHAEQSVNATLQQIDQIIENASEAARAVAPLSGSSCEHAEPLLRQQATANTFARSVNLVRGGIIYCTSLLGAYGVDEEAALYADGRLRLMDGNKVTPDRAVLIYRQGEGDNGVLIGIDGRHLVDLLTLNGQQVSLQVVVGQVWLDANGKVSGRQASADSEYSYRLASSRYPFTVLASYPRGTASHHLFEQNLPQWLLLLLLGALAGIGSYRLSLRSTAPGSELKRALDAKEFVPVYQPVVDSHDGMWHGVEALMRWQHPSEGLVTPDRFIPLAEHLGLIVPMTYAMMGRIRDDFAEHAEDLPQGFHVAINVTARHCTDMQLLEHCREFLAAFPPGRITLVLELTERQMISSSAVTEQLFAELRKLGVRIAIDDFGTGHSSLAYLREFRVDYLKIDRSFVSMIGSDALSRHLLDNILDLAVRLQLGLVAEGVETAEQRDYLSQRGVQFLQGYLFARPMPAQALFETLQTPPVAH